MLSSAPFCTFAIFATVLCLLVVFIDMFGGVFRARTKTTPNREDATSDLFKGSKVEEGDPDGVARVMRAHRNAFSNVVPFLILMRIDVELGATTASVASLCGVFTAMRFAHAFAYIRGLQPWRTIVFIVGQLCILVAAAQVARAALAVL